MVTILHGELEHKVEKVKHMKLEALQLHADLSVYPKFWGH